MTDSFRRSAVFSFKREDWENYKKQIMTSIRVHRMSLMSDGALIEWIEEKLKAFPKEKTLNSKESTKKDGERSSSDPATRR